jgi:ATP synthase proteolipid subunit
MILSGTVPYLALSGGRRAHVPVRRRLSALGAAIGTAKSGVAIAGLGTFRPEIVMKALIPVVMAGIIAIYGLVVAVLISGSIGDPGSAYSLFTCVVLCLLTRALECLRLRSCAHHSPYPSLWSFTGAFCTLRPAWRSALAASPQGWPLALSATRVCARLCWSPAYALRVLAPVGLPAARSTR